MAGIEQGSEYRALADKVIGKIFGDLPDCPLKARARGWYFQVVEVAVGEYVLHAIVYYHDESGQAVGSMKASTVAREWQWVPFALRYPRGE